ncbi:carboxypeptidase-like protein [Gelidibacter algens]|uniref:Carboxypeptidase-like protein n=1 Tax=Gelidibacter algens TaxID=49280 RepID=A0A1A7R5L8_9FLAO|nr:outer membrane beta-barrel protein [Gelidibacter algens]OBX27156.1 TonB-dependent receptor [Gelidibacter algens]RAJ18267.1 carboxypeptidase-like protein [Gelidibacter algens]
MKKFLCVLALLSCTYATFSQGKSFKITGTLISEEDQSFLESATVYLETLKDSTLVTYTISDKNGTFVLDNTTYEDSLNLIISYIGFETHSQIIKIGKAPINLKNIALKTANVLDEVIIRSRAPITIKKDTLEFNVASFKTKKDANVEDLLKELPGVEVDEDGKIKVNGKEVNKILVNGKPFFGDDPTITTRNLTKELIEKIQITDTKSKAEAFSGEKGDSENKTINLTIKEENNKGVFGRVAAGAGTDDRYEFAGMANIFDNEQRISVLAGGNNINSSGFSFGEIRKMFGGANNVSFNSSGSFVIDGRSFGGGEGITRSNNAGVNYADEIGSNGDISADYFFSGSHSDNATATERENFLPESRYFTNSTSNSTNDTDSHSANLAFDVEIDSTFLVNIKPSFRYSKSATTFERQEASRDESNTLTNQSETASFVENTGKNFNNSVDLTKRFGAGGAFIKLAIDASVNANESDDFLNSETNIFGTDPIDIIRDQFTEGDQNTNRLTSRITYRFPLEAKKWFLDFQYIFETEKRRDIKSTFDFNESSQTYTDFNDLLSTNFINKNERQSPSVKLVFNSDKMSFRLGSGYASRTIENSDRLRPELSLKQNFNFLELDANFNYQFSPKSSFYFDYDYENEAPRIAQLQPFQDVSDPLNTITGNPNLRPSKEHGAYFGYNSFDFQKGTGYYVYANANLTQDKVVSKTAVDENFVRNTTYTNVDGNYWAYVGSNMSKDFKLDSLQTLKVRLGLSANVNKQINFNNEIEYAAVSTRLNPSLRLTYTWKKLFEIRPNYRLSFTRTRYDLADFDDRNFLSHNLGIQTSTFVPKKLEWRNDITFSYNPNVADGFQKSAWFWNSTLAYSVLKDTGTVTLKVYDLLNQNTNAQRTTTDNYIQDSQSTVLEQYFMLSFSWKFNSLGSKGESRGSGEMIFFD